MGTVDGSGVPIIGHEMAAAGLAPQKCDSRIGPEITDEDLLLKIKTGDMEAASLLFGRYSRMMLNIALRVLHDLGEAEDLVQDVFLFILTRSSLFDSSKGAARAWILQVTYHRAYDRRRYLNARSFYDRAELGEHTGLPPRRADSVEEFLAWRSCLQPAFEQLSAEQQKTLSLYFYQGYTVREISEQLRESEGNVQHYLYRGLERLRKHIFRRNSGDQRK